MMKRTKLVAICDAQTLQLEATILGFHTCLSTSVIGGLKSVEVAIFYHSKLEKRNLEVLLQSHLKDGDSYEFFETDTAKWLGVTIEFV